MNMHLYLIFVATCIAISLSPGPAVILITSQGTKRGPLAAARGALGIITCNLFYFSLAALGLGVFIEKFQKYFNILIFAGASYLVWLGLKLWLDASPDSSLKPQKHLRQKNEFKEALFTQLANPKAILFFTALLPQFINPEKPILAQIILIGMTSTCIEYPILVGYGYMGHLGSKKFGATRFSFWADRISACLLMGIALTMIRHL